MNFELTSEQRDWKEQVHQFASSEIVPVAAQHDREGVFPYEVIRKAVIAGLFAPQLPVKYGGLGKSRLEVSLYLDELYRADGGIADAIYGAAGSVDIFCFTGTEEQRERYLRPLTSGEGISAACFTEPDAGSDVARYTTIAVPDGDGYLISGEKSIVSQARAAEYLLVAAKTDPTAGHRGTSIFIVEADRAGLEFTDLYTMGLRARTFCNIAFNKVWIPSVNLVGELGKGFYQLMHFFDLRRVSWAARAVGIAQGAYDAALSYAKKRRAFGKPIASHQAIQFKLVDMAISTEAARLMAYKAADAFDRNLSQVTELAAMAKVLASRTAVEVSREAVQIHGWYGYTDLYPVERFYRDAKAAEIIEATSEILRIVAGRRLLNKG